MTCENPTLVHGTCVAFGAIGALLRGGSGSGKSDLALRFIALPDEAGAAATLIADDQVRLTATEDGLMAAPPKTLKGLLEVRGLGIQPVPHGDATRLVLVCDLVDPADVPRMPPDPWPLTALLNVNIPVLKLAPFEASAPLKLKMAMLSARAHLRGAKQ